MASPLKVLTLPVFAAELHVVLLYRNTGFVFSSYLVSVRTFRSCMTILFYMLVNHQIGHETHKENGHAVNLVIADDHINLT